MTDRETEYRRYAASARGAIELAAATATAEVARLLHWMSTTSTRRQTQIADLLSVSDGRVSQVLNGDGNITVAALAKYARAYGYTTRIILAPAESGARPLPAPGRARRRGPSVEPNRIIPVHPESLDWAPPPAFPMKAEISAGVGK